MGDDRITPERDGRFNRLPVVDLDEKVRDSDGRWIGTADHVAGIVYLVVHQRVYGGWTVYTHTRVTRWVRLCQS